MAKRTITLSDRPPVQIEEDNWTVIAEASDDEHDGQIRSQANRISKWSVRVRTHADGRAIISATYSYSTNWQGARGYSAKHGVMLPAGSTADDICRAIRDVTDRMAACEHNGDDASRWPTLRDECIADMPAEEVE